MNSNNPYHLPERPNNHHFLERASSPVARQQPNQMRVYHTGPKNGSQLPNGITTVANMLKKKAMNSPNYEKSELLKTPPLPTNRDSSRNNHSTSRNNLHQNSHRSSPHTSLRDSRGSHFTSTNQSTTIPLKQSLCTNNFEIKEIQQKMKKITEDIKEHEKRIRCIQGRSSQNNSKLSNSEDLTRFENGSNKSIQTFHKTYEKKIDSYQIQLKKIQEQIKLCLRESELIRIQEQIFDKVRQSLESFSTLGDSNSKKDILEGETKATDFTAELDNLKKDLEKKIHKNLDFVTGVISRIQKEMKSGFSTMSQASPSFRRSFLRSQRTPTLLKYIEQFKVKKQGHEIKIVLTDNQYYIDQEGYLLDSQRYYLTDQSGKQIKLDEQHILALKQNKLLE